MKRVYPILTDGELFYHSIGKGKCRFVYFSQYDVKEWNKKEKPKLTKELAKLSYDKWNKYSDGGR